MKKTWGSLRTRWEIGTKSNEHARQAHGLLPLESPLAQSRPQARRVHAMFRVERLTREPMRCVRAANRITTIVNPDQPRSSQSANMRSAHTRMPAQNDPPSCSCTCCMRARSSAVRSRGCCRRDRRRWTFASCSTRTAAIAAGSALPGRAETQGPCVQHGACNRPTSLSWGRWEPNGGHAETGGA